MSEVVRDVAVCMCGIVSAQSGLSGWKGRIGGSQEKRWDCFSCEKGSHCIVAVKIY
jgi:hypothetical protein